MNKLYLSASIAVLATISASSFATTVAQIRASAASTAFTNLTGVVTSVGGGTNRLGFTIQDATGGILVDKGSVTYTQPNVGDNVTVLNGTRVDFVSGLMTTIEAVPTAGSDVVVNSSGNALPAALDFPTLKAFMEADPVQTQAVLVRLHSLHLVTPLPAGAGTTTWLSSTTAGQNFNATDATSTYTTVLRITSDVHSQGAAWQAKTRPSETNAADTFDVVAVVALFNPPGNEISLNDPVGTSAKTDSTGPIRPATSAVESWKTY